MGIPLLGSQAQEKGDVCLCNGLRGEIDVLFFDLLSVHGQHREQIYTRQVKVDVHRDQIS